MLHYRNWRRTAATIAALVPLCLGLAPGSAQEGTPAAIEEALDGATAAAYGGSCNDLSSEPLLEFGTLDHRTVIDAPAASPVTDEAGELPRNILLQGEDLNGNGVLDPNEDRNNNGRLDRGLLESREAVPESALLIENVPEVWVLETPVDLDPLPPPGEEQAIVISHDADGEQRLIACGELLSGVYEEDDRADTRPVFIDLAPVNGMGYRGFANFPFTEDGSEREIRVVMFQIPPSESAGTPTP